MKSSLYLPFLTKLLFHLPFRSIPGLQKLQLLRSLLHSLLSLDFLLLLHHLTLLVLRAKPNDFWRFLRLIYLCDEQIPQPINVWDSLQRNAVSDFVLVLLEDEIARLLTLDLTHYNFLSAFLNYLEGSPVNDLLRFQTELLGAENVHDRENNFLFGEFPELTPSVKCAFKQIKYKKPFLLLNSMQVLTEPGIKRHKVHVLPNIFPHPKLGIPIKLQINNRLHNGLQFPQPGRVDLFILHGQEHAAGGPVFKRHLVVQHKVDGLFGQGVRQEQGGVLQ